MTASAICRASPRASTTSPALGVDAIWLCPFFVSPQRDFGYDVADYCAVDPVFGTLEDFDALLARAHALGLKVLIDQVWSHTLRPASLVPGQPRAAATIRSADWYVWADPAPDGTPPNNWLSVFGGAAWTWEPRRRQYYLHHFLSHQPALNLHNPAVMEALLASRRVLAGARRRRVPPRCDRFPAARPAAAQQPRRAARPAAIPVKLFGLQHHVHDMLQPEACRPAAAHPRR